MPNMFLRNNLLPSIYLLDRYLDFCIYYPYLLIGVKDLDAKSLCF